MTSRARAYALAAAAGSGLLTLAVMLSLSGCSSPRPGKAIFQREGCVVCHRHGSLGAGTIDLTLVSERRSDVWLREHIINPKSHNPNIGMPGFAHLSASEINALIQFLKNGK